MAPAGARGNQAASGVFMNRYGGEIEMEHEMTNNECMEEIAELSDDQLLVAFNEAREDLAKAAHDEPNSEWHQCCFAATVIYAQELLDREIRPQPFH